MIGSFLKIMIGLLLLAILVSAIQLVEVRHDIRQLFAQLQTLQRQRDLLEVEWRQLQLEQSTWGQQSRIESIAQEELGMRPPLPHEILMIRR